MAALRKLVDVVVVGCGQPKRGMGWYHATQMLQGLCPSAKVTDIVEPWFLGGGKSTPGGSDFQAFASEHKDVEFHTTLDEMKDVSDGPKVAVIAGRAGDNPSYFKQAIDKGITHIFLEKPGAPTVKAMEEMATYAQEKAIPVYMGYNKNVSQYTQLARDFESSNPGSTCTYIHNNAYTVDQLPECFFRNSEGMLKNMAVHELALAVTFYGVTSENMESVEVDHAYSDVQTLSYEGKEFTDFAKVGFTITTTEGKKVTIKADRCGGNNSIAQVFDRYGKMIFSTTLPDSELEKKVAQQQRDDPDIMPYFFLQHDDYIVLKERVCASALNGGVPEGVASLDVAIETLKVAEKLRPLLIEKLSRSKLKRML